jgi:predicted MFS family arabinose efflux permease
MGREAPVVGALIFSVIGASTFGILPLLSAGAADSLRFFDQQVGVVSLAISIGSGVSALLASAWIRRVNWHRAARASLGGMIAANLMAMVAHSYCAFVLTQGASGFFSTSIFCLSMSVISDRSESERNFGLASVRRNGGQRGRVGSR